MTPSLPPLDPDLVRAFAAKQIVAAVESLKGETITPELLARFQDIVGPMLSHLRQQGYLVHSVAVEDGEIIIRVPRCRPQELLDAIDALPPAPEHRPSVVEVVAGVLARHLGE